MTLVGEIKECIEEQLNKGKRKFVIFPYGEIGMKVHDILKRVYDIEPDYIFDNYLYKYNPKIKPIEFLKEIDCEEYIMILSGTNFKMYNELKQEALQYVEADNIAELSSMKRKMESRMLGRVGKYSYGPLCDHWLVESVGAFCSFALGSDAVENHAMEYISTHPFLYWGGENDYMHSTLHAYHLDGVKPKGKVEKLKRSRIGNDVWLGKNVIITNGADIGNGVIAAAGAIITKDVPDYAIVAGVPARIIRYRYTPEQIAALKRIRWWNWSDEELCERYEDFYMPIEEFIAKYDR